MTTDGTGDDKASAILDDIQRRRAQQRDEIRRLIHQVNSLDAERAARLPRVLPRRTR
jgi:hypothetical protein